MNPVGISKIQGIMNRWNVIYSNGETKPVSYMWSIVPNRIRVYMLYRRHIERQSFDNLLKERNNG